MRGRFSKRLENEKDREGTAVFLTVTPQTDHFSGMAVLRQFDQRESRGKIYVQSALEHELKRGRNLKTHISNLLRAK